MSKPKASIIVPVYGVEQYLAGCLDPLMNQRTTIPYEVVIVDDGSKDNSGKIAESYHQKYSNIVKVIHTGNQGLPMARNVGIKYSRGEDIMFCDSDDIPSIDFVSILEETLHKKTDVECANAGYMSMDFKSNVHNSFSKTNAYFDGYTAACRLLNDIVLRAYVWSKAFKRELLEKQGIQFYPYRTTFEDLPFVFSCYLSSKKVQCTKKIVYTYRTSRPGSILNGGVKKDRLLTHLSAIFACRSFAEKILGKDKAVEMFANRKYRFYAQMIPDTEFYGEDKRLALKQSRVLINQLLKPVLPVKNTFLEKACKAYGGDDFDMVDGKTLDQLSKLVKENKQ